MDRFDPVGARLRYFSTLSDYFIAASISSAEYGTPGVSNSAPSLVMMYMSSRKNPWPSMEAIGSKLIVVPGLSGPTGLAAIRFVVCTCQYGTFLRSDQESIACCASRLFADARWRSSSTRQV